jgi:hypothetical protein
MPVAVAAARAAQAAGAQEPEGLLSPITAGADRSESTTLLVAKVPVCLECFNTQAGRPFGLGCLGLGRRPPSGSTGTLGPGLAQRYCSRLVADHEIPVANLSDPTSETALVHFIARAILDDGHGTVRDSESESLAPVVRHRRPRGPVVS